MDPTFDSKDAEVLTLDHISALVESLFSVFLKSELLSRDWPGEVAYLM